MKNNERMFFLVIFLILFSGLIFYKEQLKVKEQQNLDMNMELTEYFKNNEVLISIKPLTYRIYSSYLQGCVDERVINIGKHKGSYDYCDDKAKKHTNEVLSILK